LVKVGDPTGAKETERGADPLQTMLPPSKAAQPVTEIRSDGGIGASLPPSLPASTGGGV
jgi:hypothetical protein